MFLTQHACTLGGEPPGERQGTRMLPSDEIRFDGWALRRRTGELSKDGRIVRLQSQPLMILEELLAHPGELVTREQLIARLWPQGVVDFDTALNSAMRRLRTALDDHAETPRYIETIPRRGYRFIGSLELPPAAAAAAPVPEIGRRSWPAIAAAVSVATVVAGYLMVRDPAPGRNVASSPAQELYLRAEHFYQRRAEGDLELARRYFEEALAHDPSFARAWSGLASAYWISTVEERLPPEQGFAKVRDAAERALQLDPALAEAHLRLANYWRISGDRPKADEHLRTAQALEPANAAVLSALASMLATDGRFAEAVVMQRQALEAEPLSQASRYNLGVYLYFAGRVAEAEQEMIRLLELNPAPQNVPELHGILLLTTGRYAEALALAATWRETADRHFVSAIALDGLGRRAEADAVLQRLIQTGGAREGFRIAEVYAHRNDAERTFEWLNLGAAHLRGTGWRGSGRRPVWLLEHSPFLRPLQQDPRWGPWYAAARRPWRQAAAGQH